MKEVVHVLLADDHPVVRRGLKAIIEDDDLLRVVAEAAEGIDALRRIQEVKPDVAIIDIEMPGLNGLGVAREVAQRVLGTRIIFMTFHADEDLMRAAMEIGGRGYLLKGAKRRRSALRFMRCSTWWWAWTWPGSPRTWAASGAT